MELSYGNGSTFNFEASAGEVYNLETQETVSVNDLCESGNVLNVTSLTCLSSGEFDATPECVTEYVETDFHCDLDEDGIVDSGELIDFPASSFVMKFKPANYQGTFSDHRVTAGDSIVLPMYKLSSMIDSNGQSTIDMTEVDVYIDWGDGSCERIYYDGTTASYYQSYHTYDNPQDSIYTVRMVGTLKRWVGLDISNAVGYGSDLQDFYDDTLVEVVELGDMDWIYLSSAFYNMPNLTSFNAEYTDTSSVYNFDAMFGFLTLDELDLSNFDISSANSMMWMFRALDVNYVYIDGWDFPEDVNGDLQYMFYGTGPKDQSAVTIDANNITCSGTEISVDINGQTETFPCN